MREDSFRKRQIIHAGVAKQQGKYVAKLLMARSKSKMFPPFRYRDLGSIAAIGRKSAIVQIHWLKLSGLLGWLVWSVAHIYYMIGFRNCSIVAMNWVWNCLTLRRGMRLITGVPARTSRTCPGASYRRPLPRPTPQHCLTPPLRHSNKVAVKHRNPHFWRCQSPRKPHQIRTSAISFGDEKDLPQRVRPQ